MAGLLVMLITQFRVPVGGNDPYCAKHDPKSQFHDLSRSKSK